MPPTCTRSGKRVAKACDQCRLKKTKCDGCNPCARCRNDNKICNFIERKRPHGQTCPEGYVEMLERQNVQLIAGVHELYRILHAGECWPGAPLAEQNDGNPLIHDVLERLGVLRQNHRFLQPASFRDGFISADWMLQEAEVQTCPSLQPFAISDSSSTELSPPPSSYCSQSTSPTIHPGSAFKDFSASRAAIDQHRQNAQHYLHPNDFDVMAQARLSGTGHGAPHAVEAAQPLFTTDETTLDYVVHSSCIDFGF